MFLTRGLSQKVIRHLVSKTWVNRVVGLPFSRFHHQVTFYETKLLQREAEAVFDYDISRTTIG